MNVEYLYLLEDTRNTLEDIQFLQEDLHNLLKNPGATLKNHTETNTRAFPQHLSCPPLKMSQENMPVIKAVFYAIL